MRNLKRTITVILLCLFSTIVIKAEYVTLMLGETKTLKLPDNVMYLKDLRITNWDTAEAKGYIKCEHSYEPYIKLTGFNYTTKTIYIRCYYEYTSNLDKTDNGRYEFAINFKQPLFDLTASPSGGKVKKGQSVTLSCWVRDVKGFSTGDVKYYYTLNGSTPSTSSTPYNGFYGIPINEPCTLKAIATWKGAESGVLKEEYTIDGLFLTAKPSGGVVEKGSNVYLSASENGADIYYTLNGNIPSRSSIKYTSSGIQINENCTLKAIAYKDGKASEVLSESYTIPVDPTGISVSLSSSSIKVGETVTANYTLSPWNARSNVSWSSDDPDIAAVNSNTGKVTGYSAGTTIIRATTANGLFDECSVTVSGNREDGILIDEENFPNEDFREYLINRYGGILSKDEIANTTNIKLNYVWNLRLTGIEYFTDLQQLDCSNSRIVGTLDLSKNTALEKLELSHCALSSLDLSNNKSLTYLDCSGNYIKGSEMNNIINSLPIYSEGVHDFVVMSESEGDGNVITKSQVAWVRRRGWITYYKSGKTLIQYEGCDPEKGDLNEDGVVDEGDLWGLSKYIMGDRDMIDPTRADINGDKNVNVADIVELVKIIKAKK